MVQDSPAWLLILGAHARAAAFSAMRAGMACRTIDLFADADLTAAGIPAMAVKSYPAGLFAAARSLPPGPWIYTGGLENCPRQVDRLARQAPLWGNGGRVLTAVRDPWQVAQSLRAAQLVVPALARIDQPSAGDGGWLLKAYRSSGGLQVRRWSTAAGSRPRADRWYLQQCIEGQSAGAIYLGNGRQARWLGITAQRLVPRHAGSFACRYAGSVGPLAVDADQARTLQRLGEVLVRQFALVGLFGVDLVIDAAGTLWPVEINPRYTASVEVLERASGVPLLAWHRAACLEGWLPDAPLGCDRYGGKAIVYASRAIRIDAPTANDWLQRRGPTARPDLADLPHEGTAIRAGQPVLTILAEAPTFHEVERQLEAPQAHLAAQLAALAVSLKATRGSSRP